MKKNIAVVMGGYSSEVEISLQSGHVVYNHLDKEKYHVYKVLILPQKWVVAIEGKEYPIDKNNFSFTINNQLILFDCVFNAIHGDPGENGSLLAYFDLINLKHTSAPFYQMALTFNKRDTLSIVRKYNIATATSVYINQGENFSVKNIITKVGLPCFVKPNNAGSSFGISKVYKEENMIAAIEKAFQEDREILIERFLDGTEVSVGVITYQGETIVLPITEIVSENDFFDYEAKYMGESQEITPARLNKTQEAKVKEIALKVYKVLGMKGFSRSEYILVNDEPHFLEMNTVPGMTEASILPQQAAHHGITLTELFGNAIEQALTI